ncbi:MAG: fructoselysine 6-kinase [Alphaproteobacteria bacterium]|nr:fructoselysine 6-kinase [Rhizobiaceae bacterium]MBU3962132.1 fructoselysine 6-kinase [Alphaproteobacteria bacterium]MBU4048500.1 fructoselysine 6-kinase [Alphaproteobacteria bacterium]MBU4090339.1 fructoselysine 6-kinase [Alphaproteobacteria bacterium]MBU4159157.1 fructoselysine 6-kinase [Alphaproteobacteria bacterium]
MSRLRFAVVGDNCVDRFLPPVGQSLVGGNAINVAVQLALMGHETYYFGAVGLDADGARVRDLLVRNGVRIDHLRMAAGTTAYTNIELTASGDRIFAFEDFGVCQDYRPSGEEMSVLATMDHVHLGWISDGGQVRQALATLDVGLSQDISVNNDKAHLGMAGLGVAFGSAGEDRAQAEALALDLLAEGAGMAVVTRGGEGSLATDGRIWAHAGIAPVEVVDTTGAGDSFIAGFLDARLRGRDLTACLERGRDCAAVTCGHIGGFPQDPAPL